VRWIYERPTRLFSRIWGSFCAGRVLIVDEDEIVAINQGDYYELPGGAVNHGETFHEAALREVREESGIDVGIKDCIDETSKGSFLERIFLAETSEEKLEGSWEGDPEWIKLDDIEDLKWRYNRDINGLLEKAEKQS